MKPLEKVDFLIVGQGIAGSLLAHEFMKAGRQVLVIDEESDLTSSNKAAGLYNPITGRKMLKTWLADELFPGLEDYYRRLESAYGDSFLFPKTIYRPFYSNEELNDWQAKAGMREYQTFIKEIVSQPLGIAGVNDQYGGLKLNFSGYVDIPKLMRSVRKSLDTQDLFRSEVFEFEQLHLYDEYVEYRGIKAGAIVFCEGTKASSNPFWEYLPFRPVKGEIMDIEAPLPTDLIINRGVFILPRDGVFRVGSTYDHDQLDFKPTEKGIKMLRDRLSNTYSGSYRVVAQSAGIRPATYDRRPFIGWHAQHSAVGIFNGFGTKGVSLVPYFARQFVNYCLHNTGLHPEVAVSRVKKLD